MVERFTIHFATINTKASILAFNWLIIFTIHFATINTIVAFNPASSFIPFTIHFATINTRTVKIIRQVINHLQYTLLLLILKIDGEYSYFNEKFTIHFATINTWIIRVTLQI